MVSVLRTRRWRARSAILILAALTTAAWPAAAQTPLWGGQHDGARRLPRAMPIPSGVELPSGVQLPPGVQLPSRVPLPSGFRAPAGLPLPTAAPTTTEPQTDRVEGDPPGPSLPPLSIPSVGVGAGSLDRPRDEEPEPKEREAQTRPAESTSTPVGDREREMGAPPGGPPPSGPSAPPIQAPPVQRPQTDVPPPLAPSPTAPSLPGTTQSMPLAPERLMTPPLPTVPSTAPPPAGLPLPTAARFELHGGVGLSTDFTDNAGRTKTKKEANLTTSLSPSAALFVNTPAVQSQVAYSLSGAHDLSSQNLKLLHALNGTLAWQATPLLSFTATDALARTDEPTQADRLNLRRERRLFESNTLSLGTTFARENVGLGGSYRLSTFFQDDGENTIAHNFGLTPTIRLFAPNTGSLGYEYLGSETGGTSTVSGHRLTATYSRQLGDLKTVGASASWAIRFAENASVGATPPSSSRFHEWSISLFNTFALPGRFAMRGSAGLSGLTSTTEQRGSTTAVTGAGSGKDEVSFTTQSGLTYQLLRGAIDLGLEQGYSETFAEGDNLGVVQTRGLTGSLSWAFTSTIVGTGGGYYRENELTGVGGPAGATGKERTWGGTLGLAVQVLRWFSLNADYSFSQAADAPRTPGYVEHRLRLSLSRQF